MSRWIVSVTVLAVVLVGGCATSAPGVKNRAGTIVAPLEASTIAATEAAAAVLEGMGLTLVSSSSTDAEGEVIARSESTYVNVSVDRVADQLSEVSIRVGTLGDQAVSMGILRRLRQAVE